MAFKRGQWYRLKSIKVNVIHKLNSLASVSHSIFLGSYY